MISKFLTKDLLLKYHHLHVNKNIIDIEIQEEISGITIPYSLTNKVVTIISKKPKFTILFEKENALIATLIMYIKLNPNFPSSSNTYFDVYLNNNKINHKLPINELLSILFFNQTNEFVITCTYTKYWWQLDGITCTLITNLNNNNEKYQKLDENVIYEKSIWANFEKKLLKGPIYDLIFQYPQLHTNKNIIDAHATTTPPMEAAIGYKIAGVEIKYDKPFIIIKFNINETLLAMAALRYLTSPKDIFNDSEQYEVFLNNEKIDHELDDIDDIIDSTTFKINNILTIVYIGDREDLWTYVGSIIVYEIEKDKPEQFHAIRISKEQKLKINKN